MKPARPLDEAALLVCAWCGPAFFVLYFGGLIIAGQVPVFSPSRSAEEVALFYRTHTNLIRTGISISFLASALYLPFSAAISTQIRRMEGSTPILAYAEFAGGMGGLIIFMVTQLFLLTATFRPERSPEITQMLHDFAWITMLVQLNTFLIQYFAIARAVIKDHEYGDDPIFPRWIIYPNYITGLSFIVDISVVFFKIGPFAWNGLVCLYVAATFWMIWFFSMTHVLIKAIRRQAQLERGETSPAAGGSRQPLGGAN